MYKFPEKLLKLRKGHNLSQDFLAKKLGIDIFDYMAIENGRESVDKITIDRLANIYGISPEELINDEEDVRILDLGNELKEENRIYRKNKIFNNLKNGKYNTHIFVSLVVVVFLTIIIATLPKSYNITVSMVDEPNRVLTANRDTVVFLSDGVKVSGRDTVDFGDENIVKVVSGVNYFVALTEEGKVKTSGFNVKYQKDIDKLKGVVDIESGESHILVLLNNGKAKCIGNNDFGQCEVSKWNKVAKIYADGHGSIAKTEDGTILTCGDIPYVDSLTKLDFKQVQFDDDTLFVLLNDGEVKIFSNNTYDLTEFKDLEEIALDKNFIAGLKKDGTVVIDIDNYLIQEKCKHLTDIVTIETGDSYLVASDGKNVYGLGDNNYNQFEEKEIELKPLDPIKNLKIENDDKDVTITFDKVINAQAYILRIEEINIDIKVEDNKFVLPLSLFEPDKKYILMINAVNNYGLYLDSDIEHLVFTNTVNNKEENVEKIEEVVVEIPFVIKNFVNEPKDDFIDYLKAHGYEMSNLETEVIIDCLDNHKIISIDGIEAGEEITSKELQSRKISYKYCEVGTN